ncbi:5408_t:CDS:2, partial [Diversispora eburnea]
MILSDNILQEKVRDFVNYLNIEEDQINFSRGWITGFKKRNSICMYKLHGEADSVSLKSLVNEYLKLQELILKYNPEDIYNTDETVLFTTNATGTHKLKPLVIVFLLVDNVPSHISPITNENNIDESDSDTNSIQESSKSNQFEQNIDHENNFTEELSEENIELTNLLYEKSSEENTVYQKLINEIETYINTIDEPLLTEDILSESEIITM